MEIGYILLEDNVNDIVMLEDSKPAELRDEPAPQRSYHKPPRRIFGFSGENFYRLSRTTQLEIQSLYRGAGIHPSQFLEFPEKLRTQVREDTHSYQESRSVKARLLNNSRVQGRLDALEQALTDEEFEELRHPESFHDIYGPESGDYDFVDGTFSFKPDFYKVEVLPRDKVPLFADSIDDFADEEENEESMIELFRSVGQARRRREYLDQSQLMQWGTYNGKIFGGSSDERLSLDSLPSTIRRQGETLPTGYESAQFHEDLAEQLYRA